MAPRAHRLAEAKLDRGPLDATVRWFAPSAYEDDGGGGGGGGGAGGSGARALRTAREAGKRRGRQGGGQRGIRLERRTGPARCGVALYRCPPPPPEGAPVDVFEPVDVSDASGGAGAVAATASGEGASHAEAVLLSNRSAAHAKLAQFDAALEDATAAVALRPTWGKAHGRVGAAYLGLGDARKAAESYRFGLTHEPASAQLQQGYEDACKKIE